MTHISNDGTAQNSRKEFKNKYPDKDNYIDQIKIDYINEKGNVETKSLILYNKENINEAIHGQKSN
jgi:hypothetical protein